MSKYNETIMQNENNIEHLIIFVKKKEEKNANAVLKITRIFFYV